MDIKSLHFRTYTAAAWKICTGEGVEVHTADDGGYFLSVFVCCPACITALPWMFEFYPSIAAVETLLCHLVMVILCELCEVTSVPSITSNGNCSSGTVFVCGSDGV